MAEKKKHPAGPRPAGAAKEDSFEDPYLGTVPVIVEPGHTLQVTRKRYGPGELVLLTEADAAKQAGRGFVRRAAE